MIKLLLAFALSAYAGTVSPNLLLQIPAAGDTNYPAQISNSFNTLDAAVCDKRTGCTIVGDIILTSGSYIGDGSLLSGVSASGGGSFQLVRDDLTSQTNGVKTVFQLSTTPVSNSLFLVMDGLIQRQNTDFTLVLSTITMSTAPAVGTYSFIAFYSSGASSGGGGGGALNVDAPILGIGSLGDHLRLDGTSVTLRGNQFNAPNQLVLLDGTARLPAIDGSQLTGVIALTPPATVFADTPILGNGATANHLRLDSSSVTLLGPSISEAELSFDPATQAELNAAESTLTASTVSLQSQITAFVGPLFARKGTTETVVSSTSTQNDDELFLSGLAANTTYFIYGGIIANSASATPDLKFGFTAPAGSVFAIQYQGSEAAGAFIAGRQTTQNEGDTININAVDVFFSVYGTVLTGSSGGTLTFVWAQNTSNATGTNVLAGSTIGVTKK